MELAVCFDLGDTIIEVLHTNVDDLVWKPPRLERVWDAKMESSLIPPATYRPEFFT